MPEINTNLGTNRLSAWIAANRKLAILGGLAVVLVIAAGLTWWRPWTRVKNNSVNNTNQQTAGTNQNTNSGRTTFERFQAVINRPVANVNDHRPTKEETAQAIQQLNQASH